MIFRTEQNFTMQTILFDLDGTLVDTAPDMASALNQTLQDFNMPSVAFQELRPIISHGGAALVQKGFNIDPTDPKFETYRLHFLDIYEHNLCQQSTLFPGMEDVLQRIEKHHLNWGIVTNKPEWLTLPLIEQLNLQQRAGCIVSGDTTKNRKPHPEPMLHACKILKTVPEQCLYIGDAERDIIAGNAANMKTLVALYGYLNIDDHPDTWNANGMIKQSSEILDWIS